MRCALCNEHIEAVELQFGDAIEVDDECWHIECYAEYFDLVLDMAQAVLCGATGLQVGTTPNTMREWR